MVTEEEGGVAEVVADGMAPVPVPWVNPEDDGALSDLSDEELDAFILGEDEVQLKSKIWHEVNSEYLQKQAAKAAQIAQDEALGIIKAPPKKRKRKRNLVANPAGSADEAVQQMLAQKRVSKKINYAKLKELGYIDEIPQEEKDADDEDGTEDGKG